jgi:ATP-binding cassette subfamily B protein
MDKGRIVERGRHDGLLATNGLYAEMWMRQQTEADDLSEAAE